MSWCPQKVWEPPGFLCLDHVWGPCCMPCLWNSPTHHCPNSQISYHSFVYPLIHYLLTTAYVTDPSRTKYTWSLPSQPSCLLSNHSWWRCQNSERKALIQDHKLEAELALQHWISLFADQYSLFLYCWRIRKHKWIIKNRGNNTYDPIFQRSNINNILVFIFLDIFVYIHDFFLTIFVRSHNICCIFQKAPHYMYYFSLRVYCANFPHFKYSNIILNLYMILYFMDVLHIIQPIPYCWKSKTDFQISWLYINLFLNILIPYITKLHIRHTMVNISFATCVTLDKF